MSNETNLLIALQRAYELMLKMPFDSLRIENQEVLALARDTIAETRGADPEAIQEYYEDRVRTPSSG